MKSVTLQVNKIDVYDEVAKTTSYIAAKGIDADSNAYDRVFTTDEDRLLLERYWRETCNEATAFLKRFITNISEHPVSHGVLLNNDYVVLLSLSNSFDFNLRGSIEAGLFSFFVASILAKWYTLINKEESEFYAKGAVSVMSDICSKVYYRKPPTR